MLLAAHLQRRIHLRFREYKHTSLAFLVSAFSAVGGYLLATLKEQQKIVHLLDVPKRTSLVRCLLVLSGQRFETTSRRRRWGTSSRGREEPVVQPAAVYTSGGQFSL